MNLDQKKILLKHKNLKAKMLLTKNLDDIVDIDHKNQSWIQKAQDINQLTQNLLTKKSSWYNYTYVIDILLTGARLVKQ